MNRAVITLPLSPIKNNELGRFVVPTLGETLANMLGAKSYLAVNLLDAYHNREEDFENYQTVCANLAINSAIWTDEENVNNLLEIFYQLVKAGFIYEKEVESYVCPCGVIDIELKNMDTLNPLKKQFIVKEDGIYCPKCGQKCIIKKSKELIFDFSKIRNKTLDFMPVYLNKDAKTFNFLFEDTYQVISRQRQTGINVNVNGNEYNIDIDFLWGLYLLLFEEEEKIIISGNHEIYQLYMVGMLEHTLKPNSKTILIGSPFLTGLNELSSEVSDEAEMLSKKLGMIFNIKWNRKEKPYEDTIFRYFTRISLEKKRKLLEIVNKEIATTESLSQDMSLCLRRFNMQDRINEMRRR